MKVVGKFMCLFFAITVFMNASLITVADDSYSRYLVPDYSNELLSDASTNDSTPIRKNLITGEETVIDLLVSNKAKMLK